MENLKELEFSEMLQISGGTNIAYEIGYAIGSALKRTLTIIAVYKLL
jgi:hypothetical protein